MFLYFAPNAVHFPMQGKEEIRDPIVTELTSNLEKPAKLDAFSIADIVEIIEELRLVLKSLSGKDRKVLVTDRSRPNCQYCMLHNYFLKFRMVDSF